jgi:hypothetical protein
MYRYKASSSGSTAPTGSGLGRLIFRGFTIILRHTTLGRTPLHEWSTRRRDLYLTKHNTHKRQTSMTLAEFEPATPASERPQTHALDRAATAIGKVQCFTRHITHPQWCMYSSQVHSNAPRTSQYIARVPQPAHMTYIIVLRDRSLAIPQKRYCVSQARTQNGSLCKGGWHWEYIKYMFEFKNYVIKIMSYVQHKHCLQLYLYTYKCNYMCHHSLN